MPKRKWDASNPLYRWLQTHKRPTGRKSNRKANKSKAVHMSIVRPMAKKRKSSKKSSKLYRKYRAFRRGKSPVSLLVAAPTVNAALLTPIFGSPWAAGAYAHIKNGDIGAGIKEFMDVVSINFTGYKPSTGDFFGFDQPIKTYSSMLMGYGGHIIANKIGANRVMRKIPFVGKYIQL